MQRILLLIAASIYWCAALMGGLLERMQTAGILKSVYQAALGLSLALYLCGLSRLRKTLGHTTLKMTQ